MSRFIRKGGSQDSVDLSNHRGSIASSDGYNICNLRSGWERIYYQDDISGCLGCCIEFIVDTEKYIGFCFTMSGFTMQSVGQFRTGFGTNNCYCTCTNTSKYITYCRGGFCQLVNGNHSCGLQCEAFGPRCINACLDGFSYALCISSASCSLHAVETMQNDGCICLTLNLPAQAYMPCLTWDNFEKFKVTGTLPFCSCYGYGVIQLLGMPKLPDIGVG